MISLRRSCTSFVVVLVLVGFLVPSNTSAQSTPRAELPLALGYGATDGLFPGKNHSLFPSPSMLADPGSRGVVLLGRSNGSSLMRENNHLALGWMYRRDSALTGFAAAYSFLDGWPRQQTDVGALKVNNVSRQTFAIAVGTRQLLDDIELGASLEADYFTVDTLNHGDPKTELRFNLDLSASFTYQNLRLIAEARDLFYDSLPTKASQPRRVATYTFGAEWNSEDFFGENAPVSAASYLVADNDDREMGLAYFSAGYRYRGFRASARLAGISDFDDLGAMAIGAGLSYGSEDLEIASLDFWHHGNVLFPTDGPSVQLSVRPITILEKASDLAFGTVRRVFSIPRSETDPDDDDIDELRLTVAELEERARRDSELVDLLRGEQDSLENRWEEQFAEVVERNDSLQQELSRPQVPDTVFVADTQFVASDTIYVPGDTAYIPGDTVYAVADTIYFSADTVFAIADTIYTSADTVYVPEDTAWIAGDTVFAAPDTVTVPGDTAWLPGDTVTTTDTVYSAGDAVVVTKIDLTTGDTVSVMDTFFVADTVHYDYRGAIVVDSVFAIPDTVTNIDTIAVTSTVFEDTLRIVDTVFTPKEEHESSVFGPEKDTFADSRTEISDNARSTVDSLCDGTSDLRLLDTAETFVTVVESFEEKSWFGLAYCICRTIVESDSLQEVLGIDLELFTRLDALLTVCRTECESLYESIDDSIEEAKRNGISRGKRDSIWADARVDLIDYLKICPAVVSESAPDSALVHIDRITEVMSVVALKEISKVAREKGLKDLAGRLDECVEAL